MPTTRRYSFTPPTFTWQHTRTKSTYRTMTITPPRRTTEGRRRETTIRVIIIEERVPPPFTATRPVPPTKRFTFTPPMRTYTIPRIPTTTKIITLTPPRKSTIYTRPPWPSKFFTQTPFICTFTITVPRLTTRRVTATPPGRRVTLTRTPPTIHIWTWTPPRPPTVIQSITPTKSRTFTIPVTGRTFTFTQTPPPIRIRSWTPPQRTKIITVPPTKAWSIRKTRTPITYTMTKRHTTIRIIIYEERVTPFTLSKEHTTRTIRFTPSGRTKTDIITPPTPRRTRYTITPTRYTFTVPPIPTRRFTLTPPTFSWRFTKTPPTSGIRTKTVPPVSFSFSLTPRTPERLTYTPPWKTRTGKLTPTTHRLRTITVPSRTFSQTARATTIRIIIYEDKGETERGEKTPPTEEYDFPPDTITYTQWRTPTPVSIITRTPPGRITERSRRTPITFTFTFPPRVPTWTRLITPTTYSPITVTPPRIHWKTLSPPTIRSFSFTPRSFTQTLRITPTSTRRWTMTPPPRPPKIESWPPRSPTIEIRTLTPMTWSHRITYTPRIVTYTATPEDHECEYPPIKIVCEFIPRVCKPGEELAWRSKIFKCILIELRKLGTSLEQIIVIEKNIKGLERIVIICIQRIGDSPCRDQKFKLGEWIMRKVVTYVGEYGERATNISTSYDESYQDMKICVIMLDEQKVEMCLRGLYRALMEIIVLEKATRLIEVKSITPGCLPPLFKHCSSSVKVKIEEKLEKILGSCIRIIRGKSGCSGVSGSIGDVVFTEETTCTDEEFREALAKVRECFSEKFPKDNRQAESKNILLLMTVLKQCIEQQPCVVRKSQNVLAYLDLLILLLSSMGTEGSTCVRNLKSKSLRQCFISVEGALPRIDVLDNPERLVKHISKCVGTSLNDCSEGEAQVILEVFSVAICRSCPVPEIPSRDYDYEISKVGVKQNGIDVCSSSRHRRNVDRLHVEDDCIPLEGDNSTIYVRIPACSEETVDRWLQGVKECVETKVTNIGLRNPDYLTVEKVVVILKACVSDRGSIECRAKYRDDFKKIMKVSMQMITSNILAESSKEIRNALNYDSMASKCKSVLYKYLTFDTQPENVKKSQAKALDCIMMTLQESREISRENIEDMLDAFEIGLVIDEEKIIQLYEHGSLKQCDPDSAGDPVHFYNAPSVINCGPGGVLVRKERGIGSQLYQTSVFIQNIATEKTAFLIPRERARRASSPGCTTEDYIKYFDKLQKCAQKRLRLKFRRKRNKCKLNNLKHSWMAMVDCMIENIGDELTCQVTSEAQMTEFLHHVARTLHLSWQSTDDSCPANPKCYGTDAPALFTCSNLYLQLLNAHEAKVPMRGILEGSADLLKCLNPMWSNCPTEVQFASLNFLYLPLGLNYDSSIKQGLKFVSCVDNPSVDSSSFPHCLGNKRGNEIKDGDSVSSIESCVNCVKKKEGICISNNTTDLVDHLKEEFSRISQCLRNFVDDENCLKDMTTRIHDKCLPEFYRLYKNITKGIVLNSIEYFRKLNRCLVDFKSECPDTYIKFTFHLYYDVLGLSTAFKPQFPYDRDSTH